MPDMFNPMHLPSTLINFSEKLVCTTIKLFNFLLKSGNLCFIVSFFLVLSLQRKSSAHYWDQGKHSNQVVYGASVRMAEETRALNGAAPTGQCLPGTEWFSQVELGVFITFISLSNGCNTLKRIRFRY